MNIEQGIAQDIDRLKCKEAKSLLSVLVQKEGLVGELYSINYETARVMVHDHDRQKVGGIPSLSFLIATRIDPDADDIDFKAEDTSFILLRVMDSAQLPNNVEVERIRVETAQRVSGETNKYWDSDGVMDARTKVYLGYAGIECRIIGTFFLEDNPNRSGDKLYLKFGSDISNYYPNRGLKVYKPTGKALEIIINFAEPSTLQEHIKKYGNTEKVKLGQIRYASTNRKYQKIDNVPVYIYPADLLSQKTALFGMTRTGKSNTTKIIAKSVYQLRYPGTSEGATLRIGQIIFDPNGEYSNENVQDKGALKNIWKLAPKQVKAEGEVVTYGLTKHSSDPNRKLMLINFYHKEMLQIGKEIINTILSDESAQYIKNFIQVRFDMPEKDNFEKDSEFFGELIRSKRRVLVYSALLRKTGFSNSAKPQMKNGATPLFSQGLIQAMRETELQRSEQKKQNLIRSAAETLAFDEPSWEALAKAFEGLFYFLSTDAYNNFNSDFIQRSETGEGWADADLEKLLEMFTRSKGSNLIGKALPQHSALASSDFAQDIYQDLVTGKLVIVDQSAGDPELNKKIAERIMWKIFRENLSAFRQGKYPSDILIYIEEAHNLLPAGSELNLTDVWVRTAKEGAKCRIGMVYATQEVSSIQKNILKNTANWFISHLNNTDETKELCKYYDFADFEPSIRRAQDKGFLRVKTLSNPFVIPVQIDLFELKIEG